MLVILRVPSKYEKETPVFIDRDFFRPGEKMYIQYSTECPEFVGVVHKHEFIEIVYVLSGKAIHLLEDKRYDVEEGDIVVVNSGSRHAFYGYEDNSINNISNNCSVKNNTKNSSKSSSTTKNMNNIKSTNKKFITYDLMFTPDFLDNSVFVSKDFSSLSSSFLFYSLFQKGREITDELTLIKGFDIEFENIFKRIYHEYKAADIGYMNMIRVHIAELIIRIFRKINSSPDVRISQKQIDLVNTIIKYLRDNYSLHISLDDLASELFFNKNYLGKIFKQITGKPVTEFLQQIRMNEVCNLLISSNKKINEIASSCGYNDMKFFYSSFRKHTGTTPNEYRKAHSNKKSLLLNDHK